jgi:hypothetical protein
MSELNHPPSSVTNPFVDHTLPALPRWRVPFLARWRYMQSNFIKENLSSIAEPDNAPQPLSGPNRKRKRLNPPVFHPLSYQFCHSCDPFQRIIKVEDPEGRFLFKMKFT